MICAGVVLSLVKTKMSSQVANVAGVNPTCVVIDFRYIHVRSLLVASEASEHGGLVTTHEIVDNILDIFSFLHKIDELSSI
jgi:hypothetical protein